MLSKKMKRTLKISSLAVLAFLSVMLGLAATVSYYYHDRVSPYIYLAGDHLGGVATETAMQKLSDGKTTIEQTPLDLTFNDKSQTIKLEDLGFVIDNSGAIQSITPTSDNWAWVTPNYWKNFFTAKHLTYVYTYDSTAARKQLEKTFNVPTTAKDALIKNENGQLVIVPGESGYALDIEGLNQAIQDIANNKPPTAVTLQYAESPPEITSEIAQQSKDQALQSLQPISLQGDNKNFTINVNDQIGFLDFAKESGKLKWQASEGRVRDYLSRVVSRGIDQKMVQRVLKSTDKSVVSEGKEGKSVQVYTLAKIVVNIISTRSYPSVALSVPINPIAITDRVEFPAFEAGKWEGRYIDISLNQKKIYLIDGNNVVASFPTSPGSPYTPTPVGVYYVAYKTPMAYSKLFAVWMPYWIGLSTSPDGSGVQQFGLHRLPCFDSACKYEEGVGYLGQAVSHGCVRMGHGDAEFIYNSVEKGTPVNVHH